MNKNLKNKLCDLIKKIYKKNKFQGKLRFIKKNSVNFGVYGIPETILIDSELKILKKYIGPLNIKDVNEIRKIVKK